jgi:exopolysaccharide biosynthesis polyprenyl glycosylphosphotransferase
MDRERRHVLLEGLQLADTLVNLASLWAAYVTTSGSSPFAFATLNVPVWRCFSLCLLIALWFFVHAVYGLYYSHRLSRRRSELAALACACLVDALLVEVFWLSIARLEVATSIACLFLAFSFTALASVRMLMRTVLSAARRRGHNLRNILIVGLNSRSLAFAREITTRWELGYVLLGFVDDWQSQQCDLPVGYGRTADLIDIAQYIKDNPVDEIAIFLPVSSFYPAIRALVARCADMGIIVRMGADLFDVGAASVQSGELYHPRFITVARRTISGTAAIAKTLLDRILALALICAFSPFLIAVAIAVKLTSPGPAIFQQWRVGRNKRLFKIYKFRTMFADAEQRQAELEAFNERSGPVFKIRKDPRVTPIGSWLRRTSFDEFPQLFNVLTGDMSLVGPRPLPVRDYTGFAVSPHLRRFSVRPGISCLWQVSGRNDIDFERWMELDLEYIESWSLWLDLKIMSRTLPAVLKGRGAS